MLEMTPITLIARCRVAKKLHRRIDLGGDLGVFAMKALKEAEHEIEEASWRQERHYLIRAFLRHRREACVL